MKFFEETVSQKEIFNGYIINVHVDDIKTEDGKPAKREVVDHNGGVCVAVITNENEIMLVKQFRYPYGEVLVEVPAGKLEKGEDPFDAMKREQLEETGTTGKNYISLGKLYPTPGYCSEVIHMWACRVDEYAEQKLDEGEFLEVIKMPLEKAVEMVLNNEIPDSKTQVCILKAAALIKDL